MATGPLFVDLRRRFEAVYGSRLSRLLLFGSRARGEATADSDVDVAVVLHGPVRPGHEIVRTRTLRDDLERAHGVRIDFTFVSEERLVSDEGAFMASVRREGIAI